MNTNSDFNFLDQQKKDHNHLKHLRLCLETQEEPNQATFVEEKSLWINRNLFTLKDGVIWRKIGGSETLVVPNSLQEQIIELNHDLPTARKILVSIVH